MIDIDFELAQFFAWARARAYREFDERMKADPEIDPNWTFSEIMQELLEEYRREQLQPAGPATARNDAE
jgi:hypothetical protein